MKKKNMKYVVVVFGLLLSIHTWAQQPAVVKKEFTIKKGQRFLNLPINSAAPQSLARIKVDGKTLDQFTINLAQNNPAYWSYFDVSAYAGKKITVEIENAPVTNRTGAENTVEAPALNARILDLVFTDARYPGQDSVYMERDRPQVHFSAQRGWINDPNGLVFEEPEYHMYFQHNPYGWAWGNMHWGHAVSRDLIHWDQLPEAIYPVVGAVAPEGGRPDAAFSGSAFLDPKNTGGFRKNGVDPLLAMYTSTGRGECLKISYDKGRTFVDYESNPILKHSGRDPKVFWYEPGSHWVMVVWDAGQPKKISTNEEVLVRQHSIYTSNDLKAWTYQSGVEGFYECPELFELPVEGEPGVSKWIMYDAHGRYVVGTFDGKQFRVEQPFKQYEHGGGYFYASQTFNNLPGKRIQIGWGRNITQPGMPFNQAMLFPTDLRLRRTNTGFTLCPTPIDAIMSLHGKSQKIENKVVTPDTPASLNADKNVPLHIIAEFDRGNAPITLNVLGYELRYDNEWEFAVAPPAKKDTRTMTAPAGPFAPPTVATPVKYVAAGNKFKIEVIVDKNILEFFVNDGELYYVTEFSGEKSGKVEAFIRAPQFGGQRVAVARKFILNSLEVHELNSIWRK